MSNLIIARLEIYLEIREGAALESFHWVILGMSAMIVGTCLLAGALWIWSLNPNVYEELQVRRQWFYISGPLLIAGIGVIGIGSICFTISWRLRRGPV